MNIRIQYETNDDQRSSTICGFLNAHLKATASKISEKVSGWAGFFDMAFSMIEF
jgi:hypothetical protein